MISRILKLILILALLELPALSQEPYRLPPQEVIDVIDAPPEPVVSFSPDRKWMLFSYRSAMPSIDDVSRRMLGLAGFRIDPAAEARFQLTFFTGLELHNLAGDSSNPIAIPDGSKISGSVWAHDSRSLVFTVVTAKGSELWHVDVTQPTTPRILTRRMNTVMAGISWFPDARRILVQNVPENRGAEPLPPSAPIGPNIQQSSGSRSPTRTYQDLLQSPYDEALFEHYSRNQLTLIDFSDSDVRRKAIGSPQIIADVEISPNGEYLLVETVQRPYSYLMTYTSFPSLIEVWNLDGQVVYAVATVPMAENIPIEGVRTGPRNVSWMSGRDATLVWNEALDGGDPNRPAEHRDAYKILAAPFDQNPTEILRTNHRAFPLSYFSENHLVMSTEYDRDNRWIRSLIHNLNDPEQPPRVAMDRSVRDHYGDPGRIVFRADDQGHAVALQDGDFIYRIGSGATPQGDLPFIDRQSLQTLESERLWRCSDGYYEVVMGIVERRSDRKPVIITRRESATDPPNYFLIDLERNSERPLTEFPDPTPQIRGIRKQLVTYERADGVPLSATLYLPADYQTGTRLPLIVWAYPVEFTDAQTAGQVSGSPHTFTRIASISHLTFLTQGYAVMDAATMPVVGDPETMNDTFIEQIVGAARAAIDKAVELGVADANRVGVGGHSYGAFMTANLLAHSDLFKAGIARSGAYNRTLTPFGFQSERRTLWEAQHVYNNLSPFMHADKIHTPLLLIHGEQDDNSGTFPIQSVRMYQAVKGHGGTVRLVMLPHESHGYRARESVLHTHAEMIEWFDKYVKNAM